MKLALAWNRCDVARNKILTSDTRNEWQKPGNHQVLYDSLFLALLQDKKDFVQLFIDNGVDLKRFLTLSRLRDLYEEVRLYTQFYSVFMSTL